MKSLYPFSLFFIVLLVAGCVTKGTPDPSPEPWPGEYTLIDIPSSLDGVLQRAYFAQSQGDTPRPLLVSLHTWSGNYTQTDPLAAKALEANWNYIHPDFRGPNWSPDACLSDKAIADIDDAIQFALTTGKVDTSNIFVTGVSGGGYATLGTYLRTRHPVKAFLAWAAISDIEAWYWQCVNAKQEYADHILRSTSSGAALDSEEARRRSPLHWNVTQLPNGQLEIYEGIHDGYTGSVPISHSLLFYNKVAVLAPGHPSLVSMEDMINLLSRNVGQSTESKPIDGRAVYYMRQTGPVSLVIFEGGHEMLVEHCFERMRQMADEG
ncbi:MAG: hypothetical protein AMXMBFR84_13400 [Candidatus Hydrogenedentota bacterium]